MSTTGIVQQINARIEWLQHAKSVLTEPSKKVPSDPMVKGKQMLVVDADITGTAKRKGHQFSASARKKIAAAQKKRWARFHAANAAKK